MGLHVGRPAGVRTPRASSSWAMAASASQVVPSEYFDSVFDRPRHLDQFEVFHRDSSERAEFIYPTRSLEYELHERPEASAIHFNRQVEIRVRASGPARATTVDRLAGGGGLDLAAILSAGRQRARDWREAGNTGPMPRTPLAPPPENGCPY
jgi:hypothetical protein